MSIFSFIKAGQSNTWISIRFLVCFLVPWRIFLIEADIDHLHIFRNYIWNTKDPHLRFKLVFTSFLAMGVENFSKRFDSLIYSLLIIRDCDGLIFSFGKFLSFLVPFNIVTANQHIFSSIIFIKIVTAVRQGFCTQCTVNVCFLNGNSEIFFQ